IIGALNRARLQQLVQPRRRSDPRLKVRDTPAPQTGAHPQQVTALMFRARGAEEWFTGGGCRISIFANEEGNVGVGPEHCGRSAVSLPTPVGPPRTEWNHV